MTSVHRAARGCETHTVTVVVPDSVQVRTTPSLQHNVNRLFVKMKNCLSRKPGLSPGDVRRLVGAESLPGRPPVAAGETASP